MDERIISVHCSKCGHKITSEKKCPNCNALFILPESSIRRLKKLLIFCVLSIIVWVIFLIFYVNYRKHDILIGNFFYAVIFMTIFMIGADIFLMYTIRRNSVLSKSPEIQTAYREMKLVDKKWNCSLREENKWKNKQYISE